jgi:hypothetical protein
MASALHNTGSTKILSRIEFFHNSFAAVNPVGSGNGQQSEGCIGSFSLRSL